MSLDNLAEKNILHCVVMSYKDIFGEKKMKEWWTQDIITE